MDLRECTKTIHELSWWSSSIGRTVTAAWAASSSSCTTCTWTTMSTPVPRHKGRACTSDDCQQTSCVTTQGKSTGAVFTKIIGHVGHFRWLGPNVWRKTSQIWREYIKPVRQMSDDPWKFFSYTAGVPCIVEHVVLTFQSPIHFFHGTGKQTVTQLK